MIKSFKIVFVLSCVISLFFVGCHKKETVEVDNETQSAVDNAVADQEYMAIVPSVSGHAINTKGTGGTKMMASNSSTCEVLNWLNETSSYTINSQVFPQADTTLNTVGDTTKYKKAPVYELDLTTACPQSFLDGKVRTGKWLIKITGPLRKPGSQIIMKLLNHKASGISYACDSMVVTTISSSTFATSYNVKLINGVCTGAATPWVIKYSCDRTYKYYRVGNPANTLPVLECFGTANGVNRQGRAFSVNIPQTSPLIKHKACQFVDKGIMELTPDGFKTRTVDYGNGVCDDSATFTVNGSTIAFKLK